MAAEHSNSNYSLLDLPDLVLYNICAELTCPFDLLSLGNTCSRLRRISSTPSSWWKLAFRWLRGLWVLMEEGSIEVNARDWMLDIMRQYCAKATRTKPEVVFNGGETWRRVDSPKFRFLFNLMRVAYTKDREDNPAVLYEQWLYDMGLYQRTSLCVEYTRHDFDFSQDEVVQLSTLGQASERDLCRRKQPFKDPKWYLKRIGVSGQPWMEELFPVSLNGSICPLLMCPFLNSCHREVSGPQGLAICFSRVFEQRLMHTCKSSSLPLYNVWELIKVATSVFMSEILFVLRSFESRLADLSLKGAFCAIVMENIHNFPQVQMIFEKMELSFTAMDVCRDLILLLNEYKEIDFVVDDVRLVLRRAINEEINKVLFPSCSLVTRINLTDSDLIGGDNSKHEMSSAAFVSDHGVLVTWHLTGRMRY
ncbi:hypothetical protein JTE90_008497 [Oedothorax gibbosus]|uniref:F-box domain-containing protein n=1 Tax=Oedothorax gibbosus TaxID=931172 RepID=A0AAV6UYN7_9ARAC|nr:hypothetical protein JTE90_008497 [Oedothorax gibbosus]